MHIQASLSHSLLTSSNESDIIKTNKSNFSMPTVSGNTVNVFLKLVTEVPLWAIVWFSH